MEELLVRAWRGLVAWTTGPLRLRFVLQPAVAALIALRAGLRDAREGRPPFLSALLRDRRRRRKHLARAVTDIGMLFLVAMAVDFALEVAVRRRIVPLEAVLVATFLAFVPYLLLCGPVNRAARRHRRMPASG